MSGSTSGGLLQAYGGMASTPQNAATIMALRNFPYKFITQQPTALASAVSSATAPAADQSQDGIAPGFDSGGAVGTGTDSSFIQQLVAAGLLSPSSAAAATSSSTSGEPTSGAGVANSGMGISGALGQGGTTSGAASPGMSAGAPGGLGSQTGPSFSGGTVGATNASNSSGGLFGISGLSPGSIAAGIGSGLLGIGGSVLGGPIGAIAGGLAGKAAAPSIASAVNDLVGFGQTNTPAPGDLSGPAPGSPDLAAAKSGFAAPGTGAYAGTPSGTAPIGAVTATDLAAPAGTTPSNTGGLGEDPGVSSLGLGDNSSMGSNQTGSGDPSANDGQGNGDNAAGGAAGAESDGSAGGNGAGNSYAIGGVIKQSSSRGFLRDLARGSGLVKGISPGRADAVHTSVPRGSYVMPADVVSGMGQGNTMAGARAMTGLLAKAHTTMGAFKNGGRVEPVKVRLSAGEYVVHPKHAMALGGGDLARGHAILDGVVAETRKRVAQRAVTAPPPR